MVVAFMRGVHIGLEQPRASMLVNTHQFQYAASLVGAVSLTTFLGAFGAPSPKPVQIWTTGPGSERLQRSQKAANARLGSSKTLLAVDQPRRTKKSKDNGVRKGWKSDEWIGGKKCRQGPSEEYPLDFCSTYAAIVVDRLSESSKCISACDLI